MKKHIAILSSSVRTGRLSHRVALFLEKYLDEYGVSSKVLDLKKYDFPLFDERFVFQQNPSAALVDFTERFNRADGLIVVSPVYNASFPAALKNVIDLYYKEWQDKCVGVISVTSGTVPGIATVQAVQTLLTKLGALVAPVMCTVVDTARMFGENGESGDLEQTDALFRPLTEKLLWLVDKTADHSVETE